MGFINDIKDYVKRVFTDKSTYTTIIDEVRNSDLLKKYPVAKSLINHPLVDDYFKRGLNDDHSADSSIEKRIAIAAAEAASKKFGFDRESAVNAGIEAASKLRDARRMALLGEGRITLDEYIKHKKVSWWSRIKGVGKAMLSQAKDFVIDKVKEKGVSYVLTKAAKYIPEPVTKTIAHAIDWGRQIWDVLPSKVKEPIKKAAVQVKDWAVEKAGQVAKNLVSNGSKVAAESVRIISKGCEVAYNTGRSFVRDTYKATVSTFKAVASTVNRAFSFFGF